MASNCQSPSRIFHDEVLHNSFVPGSSVTDKRIVKTVKRENELATNYVPVAFPEVTSVGVPVGDGVDHDLVVPNG